MNHLVKMPFCQALLSSEGKGRRVADSLCLLCRRRSTSDVKLQRATRIHATSHRSAYSSYTLNSPHIQSMQEQARLTRPSCYLSTSCRVCTRESGDLGGDAPIKYSESQAKSWRSIETFSVPSKYRERPWYQSYSVILSIAAFLVYFCLLREENDLDTSLERSLYDTVPDIEEKDLLAAIDFERRMGRSTDALEQRLQHVQQQRRQDTEAVQ